MLAGISKWLEWVLVERPLLVDPDECKRIVSQVRASIPTARPDQVALEVAQHYVKRGAWFGFATGLPANLLLSLPLAIVDSRSVLHLHAAMVASVAYVYDPHFFAHDGWHEEVIRILAGRKGKPAPSDGDARVRAGRVMVKGFLRRRAQKAVREAVTRWVTRKLVARATFTKIVPVVGGAVGALWNYVELRQQRRHVIAVCSGAEAPSPQRASSAPAALPNSQREPAGENQ